MSVLTATPTSTQDSTRERARPAPTSPAASNASEAAQVSIHRTPRASALATMSLLLAAAGGVVVLTGVLAAPGAALGLAAVVFGAAGVAATRHRHISGTGNAVLGLLGGLAALAVGVLAVTDSLSWLDPDTNQVSRLANWIEAHASWITPEF